MSSRKRTELMIAEDRARVASLLRRGVTSRSEIAFIINQDRDKDLWISDTQITHDIDAIKKAYRETATEDFQVYKNQILDELTELQKTFWQAYELSRRNKISIESDGIIDSEEEYDTTMNEGLGLKPLEKVYQRMAKVREEQRLEGNVSFLQGALGCIDRKAKILGIDAPSKIAMTDATGTKDAFDVLDFVKQQVNELAVKHETRPAVEEESDTEPKLLHD